jgi:predicted transcriptional regulator of viral defense system
MMTTLSHSNSRAHAYAERAGIRLLQAIEAAGTDLFTAFQATEVGAPLGLSSRHTVTLLHRLTTGGWLTRIKKGLYAINDPVTKLPKAHPFAIGAAIVTPSAVSHWSALQHWGLTEQVPATVTLSSPVRTFPPRNFDHSGGRAAWIVAGVRYEFIAISRPRFFGVVEVWVNERNRVPIFDRERALLDAFHHTHVFGSLSLALDILDSHLADIDVPRLVGYAVQLNVGAVARRLGWTLARLGVPPDILAPLRDVPARGYAPLDPGRPARGRRDRTWRVIENLADGG